MYQQIRRKEPKVREKKLWITLTIWLILAAALVAFIVFGFRYRTNFRNFLGDFSNSIQYALDNNSMYITVEGDTFLVLRKNIRKFYNTIAIAGSGRPASPPDREAEILLTFGDGAKLELWKVKVKNARSNRDDGMLVQYTNTEGKTYAYDSDRLRPEKFPLKNPTLK